VTAATRILVLRALGLGDLLTVVPALRGLRDRFPVAEITLAAPPSLGPLVSRIGAVDRLLPMPSAVRVPPRPPVWSGRPPALAVNLHGRGPQSVAALRATGTRVLWSYRIPDGPPWRDDEHEVARWWRLVSWYGCEADPTDLRLGTWRGARGPAVVHPGAATPERRWPARRYAEVARALAGRDPVVVTGTGAERGLALRVARLAGLPPDSVVAGATDLAGLADLVSQARVVVCGDTGVAHLATAYRTPSVVLFGPQPPSRWGPAAEGPHVALWHPEVAERAPGPARAERAPEGTVDPRLRAITTDEVLAAVRSLTAADRGGPSRR